MIKKLVSAPVLLVVACLMAGLYGAVHNQVSYTVSSEYFTRFKFRQFQIDESIPDRIGAAIVGWDAAWWMGMIIGAVLVPCGWLLAPVDGFLRGMVRVFGVVAMTALAVGLFALLVSFLVLDAATVGEVTRFGNEMSDDLAFARAGTMHNFSYLGGLIGILTGGVAILRWRRRSSDGAGTVVSTKNSAPATALADLSG